ncbi:hypothetical protein Ccrd_024391 [Cynara cardunculus var. scolymus]|uniref:Uncharacterized protein n=1 Tax=Cynara cardunculus var. scolymus TaxID=59895 RepID=A0A103XCJ6_CYNCS|nr:hypothetical protein Ccrd_024391 [Cynara cardunculus var. scolymus]
MHSRLGFLLACNSRRKPPLLATFFRIFTHNTLSNPSTSAVLSSSKINHGGPFFRFLSSIMHCGGRRYISGHAVDQFSDDEYECDYENHPASSSVANIDEWKWKLSMLLNSGTDQEIVTRDKRDKRDFEQISNLAKRMGLYCEMYGKVVVASKVVIPLSLQRRVEGLLQEHLDRMQLYSGDVASSKSETSHQAELVNNGGHPDSLVDGSLMEKVLQRRSLQMRNMQRAWEESPEGKKMLLARMSLPAFREKERLLQAIAQNQGTNNIEAPQQQEPQRRLTEGDHGLSSSTEEPL